MTTRDGDICGVKTLFSRIQIDIPMSPVRDTAIRPLRWMIRSASCKVWLAVWGQACTGDAEREPDQRDGAGSADEHDNIAVGATGE